MELLGSDSSGDDKEPGYRVPVYLGGTEDEPEAEYVMLGSDSDNKADAQRETAEARKRQSELRRKEKYRAAALTEDDAHLAGSHSSGRERGGHGVEPTD